MTTALFFNSALLYSLELTVMEGLSSPANTSIDVVDGPFTLDRPCDDPIPVTLCALDALAETALSFDGQSNKEKE